MVVKQRKRQPGGGRKSAGPISGKDSNFSTRITAETRSALDAEAAASKQSLSQIAERALRIGIAALRNRGREDATRDFLDLIGRLADECSIEDRSNPETPVRKRFEWNTDPFLFEAFRLASSMLLEELRPPGTSMLVDYLATAQHIHDVHREILATPETLAKHVFWELWDDLLHVAPMSPADISSGLPNDDDYAASMSRYTYQLAKARRSLGIGEKKS